MIITPQQSQGQECQDSGINRLEDSPLSDIIIDQQDAEQLYLIYPDLPKSHITGCPSCGKNKGEGVDGEIELDGAIWQCNCKDQLQRHKHYLNAGIGATYQYLDWSDYHSDMLAFEMVAEYVQNLETNVDTGRGLFLSGKQYGSGKTMLGMLTAKSAVMHGYRTFVTTYADMLSSLRSGWKDPVYAKWYKQRVDSAQVLMIDDIGKEYTGEGGFNLSMATVTFDSLLRTRVQQSRPTIITTNFTPKELGAEYGAAVLSLLTEQSLGVEVTGEDYRPNTAKPLKGFRRIY